MGDLTSLERWDSPECQRRVANRLLDDVLAIKRIYDSSGKEMVFEVPRPHYGLLTQICRKRAEVLTLADAKKQLSAVLEIADRRIRMYQTAQKTGKFDSDIQTLKVEAAAVKFAADKVRAMIPFKASRPAEWVIQKVAETVADRTIDAKSKDFSNDRWFDSERTLFVDPAVGVWRSLSDRLVGWRDYIGQSGLSRLISRDGVWLRNTVSAIVGDPYSYALGLEMGIMRDAAGSGLSPGDAYKTKVGMCLTFWSNIHEVCSTILQKGDLDGRINAAMAEMHSLEQQYDRLPSHVWRKYISEK